MRTQVKVKDLKDQLGTPWPHPMLKCFVCGAEYSANRGDYFGSSPEHIFKCCGRNMKLVIRRECYTTV